MVDCKWEGKKGGQSPFVRSTRRAVPAKGDWSPFPVVTLGDKYALSSGLMEIAYNTGARVVLQGPVTYEVEASGGYLSIGKLTGKLEKKVASGQWSVASKRVLQSSFL